MKKIIISFLWMISVAASQAQELGPGEKMPMLQISPMMNYPTATASFSEWKGKLVILDFWSVRCGSCIAGFPKLEKLQEQFGKEIQIVLISEETRDSVMRFFAKKKRLKIPSLPMLTGDSLLAGYFPHQYKPHQVWIDGNGMVLHITEDYNVNEKNVRETLEGNHPVMTEKKYEKEYLVRDHVSLLINDKWKENLSYYSLIMHTVPSADIGNEIRKKGGSNQPNFLSANARSAVELLARAYTEEEKYNFWNGNTIILEVEDPFPFQRPRDETLLDKWNAAYCYNYVLQVPPANANELYLNMQEELCRYFKLSASIEKRKVRCLVLSRTGDEARFASKGDRQGSNLWIHTNDSIRYIYNEPIDRLTNRIKIMVSGKGMPTPFIDATGYAGNIDIEIATDAFDYADIPLLRKELQRYGLDLAEKEWETDVLVLKERKKKNSR